MAEPDCRGRLYVVGMEPEPAYDEKFNRWYNTEHVPELLACPGFQSAVRLKAIEGSPLYLTLYDLADHSAINSGPHQEVRRRRETKQSSALANEVREHRTRLLRGVYREIFRMSAESRGALEGERVQYVVSLTPEPEYEDKFNLFYNTGLVPELLACPGFDSARRFVAVEGEPRYLVIYDLASIGALSTPEFLESRRRRGAGEDSPLANEVRKHKKRTMRGVYKEIFRMESPS